MNTLRYILVLLGLMATASVQAEFARCHLEAMAISVFAGDDTSVCRGSTLSMSSLAATISGDVTDGTWFSMGDGYFVGSGTSNITFSIADTYVPGPADVVLGRFELILVSDDPDGNGPLVEVSDNVTIHLQVAPPLVCNNSLRVSLATDCEQELLVSMLVADPLPPLDRYIIRAFDAAGIEIVDHTLTRDHIGQTISYTVSHDCSSNNSCGGILTVDDKAPPSMICTDVIIDCRDPQDALATGLPIPSWATIDTISIDSFLVHSWDDCSSVWLTHTDSKDSYDCSQPFDQIISRFWTATDANANRVQCTQSIFVKRLPLDSLVLPPRYNDLELPALSCDADFPTLDNGHPDPMYTGHPSLVGCSNIEVTYEDLVFQGCGGSYSIWRSWFIIDWCTTTDLDYNQVIKVKDTIPPVIDCPSALTVGTQAYDCVSKPFTLFDIDSIVDCSDFDITATITPLGGGQQINSADLSFDAVPVGEYIVVYTATDACGNASTCTSALSVVDTSVPFAICDGFTKVSVGADGTGRLYASSLDDDSVDNCGIVKMEVARMDAGCGVSSGAFGDFIPFCCEDIGTALTVAFRVTDAAGNANTCMVQVTVEDKLPPVLHCPDDLTISCDYPLNMQTLADFGYVALDASDRGNIVIDGVIYGRDGLAIDNCSVTITESVTSAIDCGIGDVVRTFVATDDYGLSSQCSQTITIERLRDFTSSDIIWPVDRISIGCGISDHAPALTGEPTYLDVPCAMVESTYDDTPYYISDSACVRIVREWTVIDWCIYDSDTDYGRWSYTQQIFVDNTIAPIIGSCEDEDVCSYATGCGPADWQYDILASDDCTPVDDLHYLWTVDLFDDGTIDRSGMTSSVSLSLPIGDHELVIDVEDGCGNVSRCVKKLRVTDCKRPTPYCMSTMSTVVMPSSGEVTLVASQFDLGSTDNCEGQLYYSFSTLPSDSVRILTCADLPQGSRDTVELEMWVTDQTGNADFCVVEVLLQDNSDVCGNGALTAPVTGAITTYHDRILDSVRVHYRSTDDVVTGAVWAIDGYYSVDLPIGKTYELSPSVYARANAGVSTLDLALVQRDILVIAPLGSPYKDIAADVNLTRSVTGADVVKMRRLALRRDTSVAGLSIVFVPASHQFLDDDFPFDRPSTIRISQHSGPLDGQDFVMIKMGDIDGSYFDQRVGRATPRSSVAGIGYTTQALATGGVRVDIVSRHDAILDGLQLDMMHNASLLDFSAGVLDLVASDMLLLDGETRIGLAMPTPVAVRTGDVLLTMYFEHSVELSLGDAIDSEWYVDLQPQAVALEQVQGPLDSRLSCIVLGNPFDESPILAIDTDHDGSARVQVYDTAGRLVGAEFVPLQHGVNRMALAAYLFDHSGLYIIDVTLDDGRRSTQRVVKR